MIDSIPTDTPEQQKRVDGLKKLDADKIAPFVVALTSDDGAKVSGQIFAVRNNEIFLFSQPRPIRTAHTAEGWTPETIAERSEEHTSELQSLMRTSYAVFCLKKKQKQQHNESQLKCKY